ncbi:hypothetical protein WS57_21800 [Burkholderia pseudomultivorans]|nr:hypothetical protein WS57_21800 [Burkholderia pseudomultivorans]
MRSGSEFATLLFKSTNFPRGILTRLFREKRRSTQPPDFGVSGRASLFYEFLFLAQPFILVRCSRRCTCRHFRFSDKTVPFDADSL